MNPKPLKILLIDDDKVVDFLVSEICNMSGANIDFRYAESVVEAKKLHEQNDFDVILVDLNMPIDNGWVFVDWRCRQEDLSSQVYILSSSTHSSDIDKSQQYKCVRGYFEKPFGLKHLDKILSKNQQE